MHSQACELDFIGAETTKLSGGLNGDIDGLSSDIDARISLMLACSQCYLRRKIGELFLSCVYSYIALLSQAIYVRAEI